MDAKMCHIQKQMSLYDMDFTAKLGMRKENSTKCVYGSDLRLNLNLTEEEYNKLPKWQSSHNFIRLLQCKLTLPWIVCILFKYITTNTVAENTDTPRFLQKLRRMPTKDEWDLLFGNKSTVSKFSKSHSRGWNPIINNFDSLIRWMFSRLKIDRTVTLDFFKKTILDRLKSGKWEMQVVSQLYTRWNSFHDSLMEEGDGAWAYAKEENEHIVGTILGVELHISSLIFVNIHK